MDTFIGMVSVFVWTAMPKYHRLGGLNHSLETGQSKIRVPEERLLPGSWCPHTGDRKNALAPFMKA